MRGKKILVTGGAGFIGNNIVERLAKGNEVTVFDNLSTGSMRNLSRIGYEFNLIRGDLRNPNDARKISADYDVVFHMAANAEVKQENPEVHFEENIHNTFRLLETLRKGGAKKIFFASTSTVYGEPDVIPTPETYGPMKPISFYGASKLACESLISSHAEHYGMTGVVCRFANIIGPRMNKSVVFDFVNKLKKNPKSLEILGDGKQNKSYLHVEDCVDAVMACVEKSKERFDVFNVGSTDKMTVVDLADAVVDEMGLKGVKYKFVKSVSGGGGWKGDVRMMQLSIDKIKKLGWKPKYGSRESVRKAVRSLI